MPTPSVVMDIIMRVLKAAPMQPTERHPLEGRRPSEDIILFCCQLAKCVDEVVFAKECGRPTTWAAKDTAISPIPSSAAVALYLPSEPRHLTVAWVAERLVPEPATSEGP